MKQTLRILFIFYFLLQQELSMDLDIEQLWVKIIVIIVPILYTVTYILISKKDKKKIQDYISIIVGPIILFFNLYFYFYK